MDAQISGASLDMDLLASLIELEEFGAAVTSFEALTDVQLHEWLEENQGDSLDKSTLDQLANVVRANVRMSVSEPNARLRIVTLLSDYKSLLRVRKWDKLLTENRKVAVAHICETLEPEAVKVKIENDFNSRNGIFARTGKLFTSTSSSKPYFVTSSFQFVDMDK